jgi:hypothetical protein
LALSIRQKVKAEKGTLITAFSLANLCFINMWYLAERIPSASLNYYRKAPPDMTLLWATLLAVLLVTAFFWMSWKLVTSFANRIAIRLAKGLFLVVLSYPVEKLIQYLSPPPDQFSYGFAIALIVLETTLLLGVILVVLFNNHSILSVAHRVTNILWLLFASLAINLGWSWASGPPAAAFRDGPLAPPVSGHRDAASRVVWFIFDEFDQGLAFDYRPAAVALPNLDRMRNHGFYASQANPTAHWTMLAMPALISGRPLDRAEPLSSSDLRIWREGETNPTTWSEQSSIFEQVRKRGMNAAMIGWHHPYCRIVNSSVSYCHWEPSEQGADEIEVEYHCSRIGLLRSVGFLLASKGEDLLNALHLPYESGTAAEVQQSLRVAQVSRFENVRRHALEAATDPSLDLVVVHWPTPHPYGIYDRRSGQYSTDEGMSYLDNLALVDRTVGEFRERFVKSGLHSSTTFIVTSDHPFRREMWDRKFKWTAEMKEAVQRNPLTSIPFLVKFPGDAPPARYAHAFDSILTTELVQKILEGSVRSGEDLASWLDVRRDAIAAK